MTVQKQNININFRNGLDLKTDPYQVGAGSFLQLTNSVFDTLGRLTKRNGNVTLADLPEPASYLTTFNGDLTAIGSSLQAYVSGSKNWVNKGNIQPCTLSVLPLIRNSITQTQCDTAVSPNGLVCTVYSEVNGNTYDYKYAIADSITGQNVILPILLAGSSGTVDGSPRVFILDYLFIIAYPVSISGYHLQYIAISSLNPTISTAPNDISTSITATTLCWDGIVANQNLFIAYNTTSGGQAVKITCLPLTSAAGGGSPFTPLVFSGSVGPVMGVTADLAVPQSPIIHACFWDSSSSTGYAVSCDQNLNVKMLPTLWLPSVPDGASGINNVTACSVNSVTSIYYEVANAYAVDDSIATNYVSSVGIISASGASGYGTVGTSFVVIRGVGLASKSFIIEGEQYFLSAYDSPYQPTYFLIDGSLSTAAAPLVVAKFAYQNGGGYLDAGLPSVYVNGTTASFAYLFKDLIVADTSDLSSTNTSGAANIGVYQQTGINFATITLGTQGLDSVEIGQALNLTGGFLWTYDGYVPVEQNFFIYPELDGTKIVDGGPGGWSTTTTGGYMGAYTYYYVAVYESFDNQGQSYKSAGSIPILVDLSGTGSSTNKVTVYVPTYRQTYKVANPPKITLYRWSSNQQTYFQVTSIENPVLNNTTVDYVSWIDTLSDANIQGNEILYTTGGVVENTSPPSTSILALFDNRLWMVDAEDPNTLYFSNSVLESSAVQMSDLLTYYVAPGEDAHGPSGPITALAAMDANLIIFRANSIVFINGTGPNSLGTGSTYPNTPFFITGTVGCSNQSSIVFTNDGIMFQSSKGIYLLSRGFQVTYLGAPVEAYNSVNVNAAQNIPSTNRVEFTLENGITTFYDYFEGTRQWGTFQGAPAIASTIYQNLPTHINSYGVAFQETPNQYLDMGAPVLMSFKSGWINLAGLQGYQRAYYLYLIGTFISPHKLVVSIAYDNAPSPSQQSIITPNLYNIPWGGDINWGNGSPWGGNGQLEQYKIHLQTQLCSSIQITIQEQFDPLFGTISGPGLTLTGFNLVAAFKKGYRPFGQSKSVG